MFHVSRPYQPAPRVFPFNWDVETAPGIRNSNDESSRKVVSRCINVFLKCIFIGAARLYSQNSNVENGHVSSINYITRSGYGASNKAVRKNKSTFRPWTSRTPLDEPTFLDFDQIRGKNFQALLLANNDSKDTRGDEFHEREFLRTVLIARATRAR